MSPNDVMVELRKPLPNRDLTTVIQRLNDVLPGQWEHDYEDPLVMGKGKDKWWTIKCSLVVNIGGISTAHAGLGLVQYDSSDIVGTMRQAYEASFIDAARFIGVTCQAAAPKPVKHTPTAADDQDTLKALGQLVGLTCERDWQTCINEFSGGKSSSLDYVTKANVKSFITFLRKKVKQRKEED